MTERKGDSGQMLVNPFACYLSSSENSSNLDKTFQRREVVWQCTSEAAGLEPPALTHEGLKARSRSVKVCMSGPECKS